MRCHGCYSCLCVTYFQRKTGLTILGGVLTVWKYRCNCNTKHHDVIKYYHAQQRN